MSRAWDWWSKWNAPTEGVGVSGALSAAKAKVLAGQSVVIVTISDSTADATGEFIYAFAQWLATQRPTATVTHRFYNDAGSVWNSPVTIQSGDAQVIEFWTAAVASTRPTYLLGSKRASSIDAAPASADLFIANHGLNVTSYSDDASRRAHLVMLLEAAKLKWTTAATLVVNENPLRDDDGMAGVNASWEGVEALYTDASVLNVYDAFVAAGKPAAYYDDNIHPSTPATTAGKGQAVILDLLKAMWSSASQTPKPVVPAFLSRKLTNLLPNGDLAAWPGATPTSYSVGGGATVTKDAGVVDPLGGAYSALLEGTAAQGYLQVQALSSAALTAAIASGSVTLACRVYVPPGSAGTIARISILANPLFVTQSSGPNIVAPGGWQWLVAPNLPVPSDATEIYVRLFCDTAANTDSKVYLSKCVLIGGPLPADML